MNPFAPAPICYRLSDYVYFHTGVIIPESCWVMGAGVMFLAGILATSMAIRYWLDPKDVFP